MPENKAQKNFICQLYLQLNLHVSLIIDILFMEAEMNSLNQRINKDRKLCSKYQFIEPIGSGCFGTIYKAINLINRKNVAIKLQIVNKNAQKNKTCSLLNQINILNKLKGIQGVPEVFGVGRWKDGVYMQMQLLDSSLHDERAKQFNLADIKLIGIELITILKKIHSRGIVHQDLKPQNIMRKHNGSLVIIDFGLSSFFDNHTNQSKKRGFIGTPRYASLASHQGKYQKPKDDLQSLLYVLGTLMVKKAPWFQLKSPVSQRLQIIQKYKKITNKQWFRKCGKAFSQIYSHLEQLGESELPDYAQIINFFQHKESMVVRQKLCLQNPKTRRKSQTIGTSDSTYPIINIYYATKNSQKITSKQNKQKLDNVRENGSNASFSEMAQNGLQMMQLLTQKLLIFDTEQNILENQVTDVDCVEPQICNIDKYKNIEFKNPFYV